MENNNNKDIRNFDFLEINEVSENFANINTKLLQGRHIQNDELTIFNILDDYIDSFKYFYETLYLLPLEKEQKNGDYYFYLNFEEGNKGKLNSGNQYKFLSELETIVALMLINMSYNKFFSLIKEIHWDDIKKEIIEGENKTLYQKILFKEFNPNGHYTDKRWNKVKMDFKRTLINLEKLGWIERISKSSDEIHFKIKESIHRLEDLYRNELLNFEEFSNKIKLRTND